MTTLLNRLDQRAGQSRQWLTLCLSLLLAVFLAGCVSTTPQKPDIDESEVVRRTIALAVGYMRQGEYTKAKENLLNALKMEPRSPLALTTLGVAFQLEGEPVLAEQQFKRAISYAPSSAQARNNYAAFLYSEARYQEAVDQWLTAADDTYFGLRPQIYANLGLAYQELDDPDAAEAAYVRAVELNASLPQALLALANIRFDQRNYVEAKFYHNRYISVAPQTADALWLCVRLSRIFNKKDKEASCSLALKNIFPATEQYRLFEESES